MGHPEPFGLKYLAVGNEQWQQEYFDRYEVFHRALKAKYPEIRIIGSAGPFASDAHWRFAWDKFNSGTPADIVDEHYYVPPRWLLENTDRYDRLDRNGPKIFVGEYAGHDGRARPNNLRAALAEAAYITGLWKNCDLVEMASYAPLFGKYGRDQWHPNLIWFDNTRVVLTPSYHVQALASQYRPDVVLPVTVTTEMIDVHPGGLIGVGSWNTLAEYKEIRVTGNDGQVLYESDFARGMDEWRTAGGQWSVVDGALRQGAVGEDIRAVTGDPSWTDYTLTLKARKLRGDEGFLILFQTPDIDNPVWWNLGGWRNTEHSFQGAGVVETHVPGSIEADRWYDIRIETAGGARAFLDGKLIQESKRQPVPSVYAAAGRNQGSGELILSVVNPTGKACPVEIRLQGARGVGSAQGVILNGAPDQVNSLGTPENVAPRGFSVPLDGATLTPTLPAFSAAWLRVKTE
jgi:alpha-L-arabinofuranosidase